MSTESFGSQNIDLINRTVTELEKIRNQVAMHNPTEAAKIERFMRLVQTSNMTPENALSEAKAMSAAVQE
jgi:hypothetical protein